MTTVEAPPRVPLPDETRAFAGLNRNPAWLLLRERFDQMRQEEETSAGRALLRGGGFDQEHYTKRAGFWTGVAHVFNVAAAAEKELLREQKKEGQQ